MGVSGNSVAGKGFQMFTVSEELLAKVVEAVQAGEKEARSSGNIQSFEVFCHGFRQNISLGRIFIVPPSVCSDRKDFPTALLHGAIIRFFGWGGEEVADLVEKKIGDSEFDEYSQADFDSLKEALFVDDKTGKEACLIIFAPNWMNSREYVAFHFTKDANELKNNLRHQVFAAYYDPRVSSAFNAMMTNVNTTKVDVTDITPKIPFPFLSENLLKQYPSLEKQAGQKKATVLLNHKTADGITQDTLDPQELDVFDSLNQALENSLGVDSGDGAQGEGGFKAPSDGAAVPRAASVQDAPHETPFTNVGPGTEAHAKQENSAPAMKESVQDDAGKEDELTGSPIGISIDETGVPRRDGAKPVKEAGKKAEKAKNQTNRLHDKSHPETLRVGQERLSSSYSAAYNGGFVDKHDMPPQEVRDYMNQHMGNNDNYAPHAVQDHEKQIEAGLYGDTPLSRRSQEKWGSADIKKVAAQVKADFVADHIAADFDEGYDVASSATKKANAEREAKLDKFRDKTAVSLDIDDIWAEITEDMGPAPLVDVDKDPSNPAPSNTDNEGDGFEVNTPEGESESEERSSTRPNKRDVGDLPDFFRSDEPEDDKSMSDSEADAQEDSTGHQKEGTWRMDSKFADFVEEVAEDYDEDEGSTIWCDQCEMLSINGTATHEHGCPNRNKVWDPNALPRYVSNRPDREYGDWVEPEPDNTEEDYYDFPKNWEEDEKHEGSDEQEEKPNPVGEALSTAVQVLPELLASKTADTADNEYDVDAAAAPSTKEDGESKTVQDHKSYDREQGKGNKKAQGKKADTADNPANEAGGEGAISPKTNKEKAKTADTADNPYNMLNDGQGAPENKKVVQKKDTSGPTPDNCKQGGKKKADGVSGDFSEAKSEVVSPDTVDADIEQSTVSVEDAARKRGSEKVALHFMNDYDIQEAVQILGNDPVLGKAVRFLNEFKDQVNQNSDGWAYWRAPVAAANQLMTLIEAGVAKKRGYGRSNEPEITIDDRAIAKAMGPIKAFMTRRGLAAGMEMPKLAADISGDMSEAESELEYNKAEIADEPAATDTVNPDHFAAAAKWLRNAIADAKGEPTEDQSDDKPAEAEDKPADDTAPDADAEDKPAEKPDETKGKNKPAETPAADAKAPAAAPAAPAAAPAAAVPAAPPAVAAPAGAGGNGTSETSGNETSTETGGSSPGGASTGGVGSGMGGAGTGGAGTGGAATSTGTGGAGTGGTVSIAPTSTNSAGGDEGGGEGKDAAGESAEAKVPTIVIYNGGTGGASTVDTDSGSGPGGDGPGSDGTGGSGEGSGGGGGGGGGRGTPRNPEEPADAVSPGVDSEGRQQGNLPEPQGNQSKGKPLATKPELRGDAPVKPEKPQPPHEDAADDKDKSPAVVDVREGDKQSSKHADWAAWECDNCSNMNAGGKCLRCGAAKPGGSAKSEPKAERPAGKKPPKSEPSEETGDNEGEGGGAIATIQLPHGVNLLPDNSQWTNRFKIKSESSGALYTIAQNKNRRYWGCDCPGWIGHRKCKHLTALGLPWHEKPFEAQLKTGALKQADFEAKLAAAGDEFPEEVEFDFGAGDLADIVMTEETDGDSN